MGWMPSTVRMAVHLRCYSNNLFLVSDFAVYPVLIGLQLFHAIHSDKVAGLRALNK